MRTVKQQGLVLRRMLKLSAALLLATTTFTTASADLLQFSITGVADPTRWGQSSVDPFGADPHRTINVNDARGTVFFDTATNLFDVHLHSISGVIHALNGGRLDYTAVSSSWGGPQTDRAGHEPLRHTNMDNALNLRGFADGRPDGHGNEGYFIFDDEIGRHVTLTLNNMFFAANPWEQILFVDIGRVFAGGHVPGGGYLALRFDTIPVPPPPPSGEVPEPGTLALLFSGLLGSAYRSKRSARAD